MNIIRLSSILSSLSCSTINSRLSLFTPKQYTPNPFIIFSLYLHTSTNQTQIRKGFRFGFEEIKNVDDALHLFDKMIHMSPYPSPRDFSKLFKIVMGMRGYHHVIVMARSLSLHNEFIMSILVNCYCQLGMVDFGLAVVGSSLKCGVGVDVVSVNCVIKGLFLMEDVGKAVDLFKRLVRFGEWEVSAFTVSIVTDGLCKSGNVVDAVELVEVMEKRRVQLNAVVYTTVIDGLCKAGLVKDAMRFLLRMVDRGVLPDVVTYTSFIHGLCYHREFSLARRIFNDLPSKMINPNVVTYTVMIHGLCSEGLFEDAKEMLDEMEQLNCIADNVTYNIIIQSCLKHTRTFSSINLFNQIVGRDFLPNAGTYLLFLRQLQGNCDGVPIRSLIQKLLYSDPKRLMQGINDVMLKSLIQKFSGKRTIS